MKVKRLFSVIGLGLFAMAAAGAGVLAAKGSKAEPVKADDPDTWMMHFSLESNEIVTYMDADSMWVQTYTDGVGNARWFHMYQMREDSEYFAVNATFPEDYTFNRVQFKFTQDSVEKWGTPYTLITSKEGHAKMLYATFNSTWSGDNWNFSLSVYPEIDAKYKAQTVYLAEDVANKRFIGTGLVSDESDYYTFYYRGGWKFAKEVLTDSSKDHFSYLSDEWCSMKAGTYDVILKNDNADNGIVEIKKHEEEVEAKIYYVTNSDQATVDYIYSWGGEQQFGAFPGTPIADLVTAEKARELTGNGVIHFQGGDTAKLIYEIKVSKGYPDGDLMFMFNNGTDEYKSVERPIQDENAYWWTGEGNVAAGDAIEFLCFAEAKRNAVEDYSVCNVTKENAKAIVDLYNVFDEDVRETYIDCTTVYTWADASKESETLHTYRKVVEELGRIAGVEPVGANFVSHKNDVRFDSTTIIIIVCVSVVSVSSLSLLLVIKRRKQN